jgi:phthalate 4,5-cis-dihydrodiol dehydrogenase
MPEVLRLGIAGLGEAVTEFIGEFSQDPRIKIVAAADSRAIARERFRQEFQASAYDSVEALCQSPDVDVVYIATPHELHVGHTLTALENRKHVIVEKPMALTIKDCEAMNAAADRYGVKLLSGHNHSYDAAILKMREIIKSGELGRLCMINAWNYTDFMVRPYPDQAIETSRGVVLNQGPHQVDMIRLLGGGLVRSVRAMAGRWDPTRPGEGAYLCYLEFEDGVAASLVFNGYGFFDTAEFMWWLGEGGTPRYPDKNVASRRNYTRLSPQERARVLEEYKEKMRYGSVGLDEWPEMPSGWEKGGYRPEGGASVRGQPRFGVVVATCERGDMRQSQDGILIYGDEKREVAIPKGQGRRKAEIDELYDGVVHGKPMLHDGRWGEATIEVCLAILQSSAERREIPMAHQVPTRD